MNKICLGIKFEFESAGTDYTLTFSSNPTRKTQNDLHPQFALPGPSLWQRFNVEKDLQWEERDKIYFIVKRALVGWRMMEIIYAAANKSAA